jgi:hypothetical protein
MAWRQNLPWRTWSFANPEHTFTTKSGETNSFSGQRRIALLLPKGCDGLEVRRLLRHAEIGGVAVVVGPRELGIGVLARGGRYSTPFVDGTPFSRSSMLTA